MNADLHCHSSASDGLLSPAGVVRRAKTNGVELLALTDHDEITGLAEARNEASGLGVDFVDGVEISVSWGADHTLHIVGLGIDTGNEALRAGIAGVRSGRDQRARRIASALENVGICGAYEGALRHAGNPALVGRAHFARYIVELGLVRESRNVFEHWLAKGKLGYVPHPWANLADALSWIRVAGGVAVLAHPGRYRVARTELHRMLAEFKEQGGEGIEVVSGLQTPAEVHECAGLARRFGFLASCASDFHGPDESRVDVGRARSLPDNLTPVWVRLR
ncbi:MAG: PHP domain-containing protein [Proteobacteria bacterium]|nr:PHP domain-containing protein [Pseudomonadota bacterium]HQR02620.1 3',5'-nucleoside bisphosphate phosphatase [Rhodocyclaceae bacterium]